MHSQNYNYMTVKSVVGLKQLLCSPLFSVRAVIPLALFCGLILVGSVNAFSQITEVATTSATTTNSTTLTFSHTPGSGSDKLLLVAIGLGNTVSSAGGAPPTVTSVTFNGVPMTLVLDSRGDETRSVVYRLTNPAAGPANVVVTASSNTVNDGSPARINASATTFINVNQTTPLGTPDDFNTTSTGSGTLNLTLPTTTLGDVIYSAMTVDEGATAPTITVASGQTTLSNQSGASFVATHSASSYEPATGSAVTSTYTFSAQDHSGIIVAIKRIECILPNCGSVTLTKIP